MKKLLLSLTLLVSVSSFAESIPVVKEIAFTFDDAPAEDTVNFKSVDRTKLLVKKLKSLKMPKVMVFSNPCKSESAIYQMSLYVEAGHLIGNHSCSHPRLDDVGSALYIKDIEKGDKELATVIKGQKFFRFPYLNEGYKQDSARDDVRAWLKANNYRNGMVSADNDDYIFSFKMAQAQGQGKKINHKKLKAMFVNHVVGGAEFYNEAAVKYLGRSPKHVLLLHERDATVMYLEALVAEFKKRGWTIIPIDTAFNDPIYFEFPTNKYSGNGIIPQMIKEKNGEVVSYEDFDRLKKEIDSVLK